MTNYLLKISSIFFFVCMITGLSAQEADRTDTAEPKYFGGAAGEKLDWAMFYLQNHYVDSTHNDHLAEIAIRSILKQLDPFSRYQSREELDEQLKADEGIDEEGIGIRIYPVERKAMITDVTIGGAADKAGLERGDLITKVNGESVMGLRMDTISNRIQGPDSTFVSLTFERNQQVQNKRIQRSPVPLHSVDAAHMLTDKVGYIKIGTFNSLTVPEFQESFKDLKTQGLASLVLDLRFNLGGVVNAAVGLADEFLDGKRTVIFTHSFNAEREEYFTEKEGAFEKGKLVILVNQSTASASEIFTAAMQDWDRALVIGQSSYGKGLIQQSYLLGDGSAMRITVGKYYTPAGRNVQGPYFANEDWLRPYLTSLPSSGFTRNLPVPESSKYNTRGNRRLLTSTGGITPDIYVSNLASTYHNSLNNLGLLYGFSIHYSHSNRQALLNRFLTGSDFDANKAIDQEIAASFQQYAQAEITQYGYQVQLQPTVPPKLLNNLKAWIGSQVWDNNTYYSVFNELDPFVLRALESIENGDFETLGVTVDGGR